MTKLLVNFTRRIVYLLWIRNSGYIYSAINNPVNVTGKYSKSSFKIRRWQRYCLHSGRLFIFRYTRKKFILEEFPKFSEIEDMRKIWQIFNDFSVK